MKSELFCDGQVEIIRVGQNFMRNVVQCFLQSNLRTYLDFWSLDMTLESTKEDIFSG